MASRFGLQIRAASPADGEGIADLLTRVGAAVDPSTVAARLDALKRTGCASVLLAVEWGPPSGLLAFHWHPTLAADRPSAQIDWLAVTPDERRRGIARILLKAASQAARLAGCGSLSLIVPPRDDGTLRAFCSASGFEPSGVGFARSLRKTRGET